MLNRSLTKLLISIRLVLISLVVIGHNLSNIIPLTIIAIVAYCNY